MGRWCRVVAHCYGVVMGRRNKGCWEGRGKGKERGARGMVVVFQSIQLWFMIWLSVHYNDSLES